MAFRKTLAQRLFNINKISCPSNTLAHSPFSSPLSDRLPIPPDTAKTIFHRDFRSGSDSGNDGFFRRFIQKRVIVQLAAKSPELQSFSLGDKLMEKLKGMNTSRDRLRFDGLNPPTMRSDTLDQISVEDARKLLRLSWLEMLKTKLKTIPKATSHIPSLFRSAYVKMLDDSGAVIVLGKAIIVNGILFFMATAMAHD